MTASAGAEALAAPSVRYREYLDQQPERLAALVDRGGAGDLPQLLVDRAAGDQYGRRVRRLDASAIADAIGYAVDQPEGVDVNEVIVRSTASLHD